MDLLIIGVFLLLLVGYVLWQPDFINETEVSELINRFGAWGPITIVGFIATEVVVAPIPGGLIPIAIGVLYGLWPGVLYVWLGNMIGSLVAFWLSRKAGRWLVHNVISKKKIKQFDGFIERNRFLFWIIYLVPLLPMDTASFAAGLSTMSLKKFLQIISIGYAVHLSILTLFGQQLLQASHQVRVILGLVLMIVVVGAVTLNQLIIRKRR